MRGKGCCYNRRQPFAGLESQGGWKEHVCIAVSSVDSFKRQSHGSGDLLLLKRLGHILVFLAMVAWEVVKANVAIIRIVLSHHMEITPCLVPVKTDLKSAGARAALANAITLTPGTITVDVKDDVLWVHALTAEMAEGLKDWHVARQLARIEEVR